ncbi:1-phosphatidylinositol 4,5-bisphosphate phosphodiesterase delta-4 isoform X2 [Engystomops pustulosus]|uniref:1-phosphatidylinositol 4,5-bisphosphate phosphodiesterase delta-4 isoform X2 n=1 Tax=Engystomops pustulosus TaxID=76066 RepID=UPI003AFA26F4
MTSPCCARLQLDDNLQLMQAGSVMRKVKSRNWKKQRYFKLQEDCMTIWYKSKKTGNTKSTFSISDIETVREGHQSEVLQSIADEFEAELCFTIVFYGRRANLDLVANTSEEAQSWIQGLEKLIETVRNMDQKEILDQWICDWFQKADKNRDGRMNFKEVQDLLKMMNVDMNEQHAYRLFQMADKSESGTLEGDEFVLFYKALTQRDDVLKIFQDFSKDGKKLTLLEFVDFLHQEQLETENTEEFAMDLIARYEPSETEASCTEYRWLPGLPVLRGGLYLQCEPCTSVPGHVAAAVPLLHLLLTQHLPDGGPAAGAEQCGGVYQGIKEGLPLRGGGHLGRPQWRTHCISWPHLHLQNLLQRCYISHQQVSDYPVILSLENHCSVEQQDTMAQHLKSILGEKLVTRTLDGRVPVQLPSPEELRGKIILKGKKIGRLEDSLAEPSEDPSMGEISEEEDGGEVDEENIRNEDKKRSKKSKDRLSQELSDCIIYCKSVPFESFRHSRTHYKLYEMSSFTEYKARKLVREPGNEFVRHNAWQLTRVYPTGLRTDSSNYNPQDMWNVGCQMVALNFQTAGVEMDLNDGLFQQNGRCGYILKPSYMRHVETRFNPDLPQDTEGYSPLSLSILVISAQQLPKDENSKEASIIDPLVRVEIFGVPIDQSKQETKYIENNGFNPMWYETLQFKIHVPELALVRFVVEDYDKTSRNDFIGQYTLPFKSVKSGYRHVHLLSKDGTKIPPASLFVYIRITDMSNPVQEAEG